MGVFNNFPYANFHELNADWIVEQVRKVMDEWEEYRTDMNLWKQGVNDQLAAFQAWFDNLDVQDEVRTVINELIQSGEFIEIAGPQIVSATEAWLTAHVTPTTPAVDNTLSISGAAADAKVTGDRISDLKEDLTDRVGEQIYDVYPFEWITGAFIKTAVSVGNTVDTTPVLNGSYAYAIIPVSAGDRFVLTALGGGDPRAWAFTDTNYVMLALSTSSYSAVDEVLVAAANGYLIVNSNTSVDMSVEKTVPLTVPEYFDEKIGDQIYKETAESWIEGAYIKTGISSGVVDTDPISNASYSYAIIPVLQNDVFKLTAIGGSDPRTWAFTDTSYNLISKAVAGYSANELMLSAPTNGYLIVNTNTKDARFLAKITKTTLADEVEKTPKTVKDYGAVGDGVTDDTFALLYALHASSGKTLIIPEGTFLFAETLIISSGINLVGYGDASVLKQANTFRYGTYNWREGNKKSIVMIPDDANGCILDNFRIDGQTAQFNDINTDGLTVMGTGHEIKNLTVSNIDYFPSQFASRVASVPGMGIQCIYAENVLVDNCNVYNCGYEDIGTEEADHVMISNCKAGNANQTGIQIHRLSTNIKVTGNTVKYNGALANAAFTLHADDGYEMRNVYASDNYFDKNIVGVAGHENSIHIVNNTINGGISQNNPIYPEEWFICDNYINGRINLRVDGVVIANNMIYEDTGYYMIIIRGNNRGVNNNVGLGSVKLVSEEDHES